MKGIIRGVIAQNIADLHFKAGSSFVAEYPGRSRVLQCTGCGKEYNAGSDLLRRLPQRASAGAF